MKKLLTIIFSSITGLNLFAQCPSGQVEVTIDVNTDAWGYEVYWELVLNGNGCGNGTIFSGGNTTVGCNGGGLQMASTGSGYANSTTISEGPWCLSESNNYDIVFVDDYGDGGAEFEVSVGGYPVDNFTGTGANSTHTFTADLPPSIEVKLDEITTPAYINEGANPISGRITNNGISVITSLDITYSINGLSPITDNVTGLSIQPFSDYNFTHATAWTDAVGTYSLNVVISNFNGAGDDVNTLDNELTKTIVIKEPIPNIIPSYIDAGSTFTFDVVANSSDDVALPTDLDFHPNGDLWVINYGTESTGGSTVKITDPLTGNPTTLLQQDGNAWHFMSLPSGISFSDNGNFATSTSVYDANHQGGGSPFTGPTLWDSDPAVYAQPSGGNGSHIDMLHESPYSMGIAAYHDNAFWVFDRNSNDIVMYDFKEDHGPGNDYHGDGVIHRYPEVVVDWVNQETPSHLKYQKESDNLFIMDAGNDRVVKMDVNSGAVGGTPAYAATEPLAEYENVTGVSQTDIITTGFVLGCGIDVIENYIIISDFSNGDIIIYDHQNITTTEVARIETGSAGVAGVVVGPEGRIWYVNKTSNEVVKIEPSQIILSVESIHPEKYISISPNPTNDYATINFSGLWEQNKMITVVDVYGKVVLMNDVNTTTYRLDTSSLATGAYFVQVVDGEASFVKQIMVK